MLTVSEYIHNAVRPLRGDALRRACEDILCFLVRMPNEELEIITFKTLANALHRKEIDHVTLNAIAILRSISPPALVLHYMYIDDDIEYEISNSEASEAIKTGHIILRNGIEADVVDKLFPFFSLSEELKYMKIASNE